ncbi:hypothetical protein GCM10023156_53530 [Novipirellula rosea]|uniref:Uncharacterized protein n=1 Tax=Novipirellula rosea TaxID=1031540 RepID=A0ABP8NDP2_9BACT
MTGDRGEGYLVMGDIGLRASPVPATSPERSTGEVGRALKASSG